MIKYEGTLINVKDDEDTGNAFVNATVTVRKAFTGDIVTLYSDNGITEIDNPVKTDILGNYSFWVKSGLYRLVFNEGLLSEKEQTDVLISGAGAIEVGTLDDLTSSSFPLGSYLEVDSMGKAPFLVMPSDTTMSVGDKMINNRLIAKLLKTKGFVKPEWYGAKGDGATDDYQAIQYAIDDNLDNGSKILFTSPYYRVESQLDVTDSVNLTLIGQNAEIQANFSSDERIVGGTDANGLYIEGISFNQRYSVTGFGSHIISLLDPRNCKIITCDFGDFAAFGVLMFTNDRGASGLARNNHIVDCTANGFDVSYGGGYAMESMADSSITGRVTRVTGNTPGYSVNLKNNCTNCMVDVQVSSGNAGLVLSDDGPSTLAAGVKNSFVKANVVNCKVGASFNKTEGVHADLNISGSNGSGDVGLAIYGLNLDCDYDVSLFDCDSSGYAITSRSDNQRINVRRYDMSANKLILWEPGTDRNRLVVGFASISGNGPNIIDYVDDDASNNNNEVVYLRDAPTAINSGGTYTANFVFPLKGASVRTDNMISLNQVPTMTMRVNGSNMLSAEQAANSVSPGSDNTLSSGRASFRWSEVFAANGTINTSDEREKQQVRSLSEAELSAASRCKAAIKAFKWNEAVERKGDDDARWHIGWIAQEIKSIFEDEGLDAFSYGVLCYNEWDEEPEQVDADGNVIKPFVGSGDRYGLRKDELIAFIISVL